MEKNSSIPEQAEAAPIISAAETDLQRGETAFSEASKRNSSQLDQTPETDLDDFETDDLQKVQAQDEAAESAEQAVPDPTPGDTPAVDATAQDAAEQVTEQDADTKTFMIKDEVLGTVALMHTSTEEVFAKVDNGRFYETMPVESPRFLKHIAWRHYKKLGDVPSKAELKKLMRKLVWTGLFDGTQNASFIRYAKIGDALYVDLGDRAGHYVKITGDGWDLHRHEINSPWFPRKPNMLEQVKPEKGGSIADLKPFLNIRSEVQFILIVGFILGAMNPNGPFPMLTVHGPQGAAKSTMLRIIGSLVDPSFATLSSEPKSVQDLFIAASHGWLQNIDNVSAIKDTMSNAYCRMTTGATFRTRKLYTTNEEVIITVKCPLAFNGITMFAKQNDFLDRSIWIELASISTSRRRTENEFWTAWEQTRPKILGAFYSALATAMKNYDQVELDSMPRLADFAKWVVAAEPACPWESGKFLEVYEENRGEMIDMAIEADPIAEATMRLMAGQSIWQGNSTELLRALQALATDDLRKQKDWPKAPNVLSTRLMRLEGFLSSKGIGITRERRPDKRLVILTKINGEKSAWKANKPFIPARKAQIAEMDDREDISLEWADGEDIAEAPEQDNEPAIINEILVGGVVAETAIPMAKSMEMGGGQAQV